MLKLRSTLPKLLGNLTMCHTGLMFGRVISTIAVRSLFSSFFFIRITVIRLTESIFAIHYPYIFLTVNRIKKVPLLMRFTLFSTVCQSSNSLWSSAYYPTRSCGSRKALNACGLTLVSFTRLHNRYIVLSDVATLSVAWGRPWNRHPFYPSNLLTIV